MRQKAASALNSKKVRLSEIFTSIEGEGILFGTKTMFVRLAGCPLNCHWCDTPHAIPMGSGSEYSLDGVKNMILEQLQPNTYKVNFTGGEPLAQHEAVMELAKFAKEKGLRTYLESACYDSARFAKVLPFIDICKIEFKLEDARAAADGRSYSSLLRNELECLKLAAEERKARDTRAKDKAPAATSTSTSTTAAALVIYIKVVVTNSSSLREFQGLAQKVFGIIGAEDIAGFIIQPSHNVDAPTLERLFGFYDAIYPLYSEVRIVPQLHKIIGAR